MELYIAIASSAFFAATTAAGVLLYSSLKKQIGEARKILADTESSLNAEINNLEKQQNELLIQKTEAETKLFSLQEQLAKSESERKSLSKEKEQIIEQKNRYEREMELARQRVSQKTEEMENWKKTKTQHIEIAKASVLEAGSQLSSKLLDDHKREVESAKKENEKIVKQTTEELHGKFQNVFESMSTLNDRVSRSSSTVDKVHRSLLNPSGAGSLGEITLENIFRNSGLVVDQDYKMQYNVKSAEGRDLRPDAVVFLPDNHVMVVDSKASKFFVQLGEEGLSSDEERGLNSSLKQSMNQHLKDLTSRNYSKAIEDSAGKTLARVYMFLPTEVALEKLRRADSSFMDKAYSQGILPIGPTGLLNELMRANMQISGAKQEENAKIIIAKVKDLLGGVAMLHGHAGAMGKSLKAAMDKYDKFSGSFNRTFMSKARDINNLGVGVAKLKELPPLQQYKTETSDFKAVDGDLFESKNAKELLVEEENA